MEKACDNNRNSADTAPGQDSRLQLFYRGHAIVLILGGNSTHVAHVCGITGIKKKYFCDLSRAKQIFEQIR